MKNSDVNEKYSAWRRWLQTHVGSHTCRQVPEDLPLVVGIAHEPLCPSTEKFGKSEKCDQIKTDIAFDFLV